MTIVVKFYYDLDIPYDIPTDICVYGAMYTYCLRVRRRIVQLTEARLQYFFDGAPKSQYWVVAETLTLHSMCSQIKRIE